MGHRIPELGIEAYKDRNNTLYVDFWQTHTGWREDILWGEFVEIDGVQNIIYRLHDYFSAKCPMLLAHANPNIPDNINISSKKIFEIVRNMLSTYYSGKTIRLDTNTIDTSNTDIIFFTNGEIIDNMDSVECNVNCKVIEYIYSQVSKTKSPDFLKNLRRYMV